MPLPPNLSLVTPSDTLPAQVRQFSGKWFGTYETIALDHVLVVEDIKSPDEVIAVYAVGSVGNSLPGWFRVTGKIDSTGLNLRTGLNASLAFQLQPDGTLAGTFSRMGAGVQGTNVFRHITMSRSKD